MPSDNNGQDEAITAANVDLNNCDRELIHTPDLIQPHGAMLVLRLTDLVILRASENTASLFGVAAADLAMKELAEMLGSATAASLHAAIANAGARLDGGPMQILPQIQSAFSGQAFAPIAHRAGNVLILELERINQDQSRSINLYPDLINCLSRLNFASGLTEFLNVAVMEIRAFTGFDRVMAYKFAQDGSGCVVAEARRDDLYAYLGHHFPASDIPAPARRLHALSWLRHLPNVDYTPVRLWPPTDQPVDMSRSLLRHVSVMYSDYLKNIQVHATMVMPLMKAGRLWGLVSCQHHAAPLHVPNEMRTGMETLAHMMSLLMAEQEDRDTVVYRQRMNQAIDGLGYQIAQETDYYRGLSKGTFSLHGWIDATGAALATEHGIVRLGITPSEEQVSGIAAWLTGCLDTKAVFATDRLEQLYAPATAFQSTASGLLAVRLMQSQTGFIMWFRPEIIQTIDWAGDPNKPVQVQVIDGQTRLTPRASFELWREDVRNRANPWLDCEKEAARALRQVITEEALMRMNEDLMRSNAELDSFAFVAAHDLKEPLRGISNFAAFLKSSAGAKLTEEERGRIETIIRLTRRMDDLTDALLEYSRVGRTEFVLETVDLNELLRQTLESLETRLTETGVAIRVPRPLPAVRTDRISFAEVLSNLITNAIKYNDHPAGESWVEIGWRMTDGQPIFLVQDNGIGIAPQHLDDVFQIFRRLHPRDAYGGGNGAGLTIARRTVERLGGRLWVESDGLDKGSTFLFSLDRPLTGGRA